MALPWTYGDVGMLYLAMMGTYVCAVRAGAWSVCSLSLIALEDPYRVPRTAVALRRAGRVATRSSSVVQDLRPPREVQGTLTCVRALQAY